MALYELHLFTDGEISSAPAEPGVYVLFQVENAVHVDGASNLRNRLRKAKAKFPAATHFSVEIAGPGRRGMSQRVRELKQELSFVRTTGFLGCTR